ncbi:MAG: ribonuclease III [Lachnospiraceae bacterium]|nr:ribonuclease III [Lachnospiraceae bacterium]
MHREDYDFLERAIGYSFKNRELLKQALTHSSYANELTEASGDYQRMEFLGDAVIELISSKVLYDRYPGMTEGELSKKRASMVCEPALAFCARNLRLHEFVRLGRGEELGNGRARDSIVSDVMEAVIGAVYIEGGFEEASRLVIETVMSGDEDGRAFYDAKSVLQEYVQQRSTGTPEYRVIRETGPDHARVFECAVYVDSVMMGTGKGSSKKAGEQAAAFKALEKLKKHVS